MASDQLLMWMGVLFCNWFFLLRSKDKGWRFMGSIIFIGGTLSGIKVADEIFVAILFIISVIYGLKVWTSKGGLRF